MQVRYGRRQSVQMDPAPAPEAEVSTSFTQGVDASKELVDDAKPISKSFTQDSTLENRITFKDDNNDGTVETKKRFAGVSRRKSMTYEREEFEKRSAEEGRKERNRRKLEETELVDNVSPFPPTFPYLESLASRRLTLPSRRFSRFPSSETMERATSRHKLLRHRRSSVSTECRPLANWRRMFSFTFPRTRRLTCPC